MVDGRNQAMEGALRIVGVVVKDYMLVSEDGAPDGRALRLLANAAAVGNLEQAAINSVAEAKVMASRSMMSSPPSQEWLAIWAKGL